VFFDRILSAVDRLVIIDDAPRDRDILTVERVKRPADRGDNQLT
jgi:hypothetical protein